MAGGVDSELERSLKFFTEVERPDEDASPEWMQTEEMQQAMNTLKAFSENERAYRIYQTRLNHLSQQRSLQRHLKELQAAAEQAQVAAEQARAAEEQARAAEEQARVVAHQAQAEKERERAEKEAALAELERLRRLLEDRPG